MHIPQPEAVALCREACHQCSAVVKPGRSPVKHARPTTGDRAVDLRARLRDHNHASICGLSLELKGQ